MIITLNTTNSSFLAILPKSQYYGFKTNTQKMDFPQSGCFNTLVTLQKNQVSILSHLTNLKHKG